MDKYFIPLKGRQKEILVRTIAIIFAAIFGASLAATPVLLFLAVALFPSPPSASNFFGGIIYLSMLFYPVFAITAFIMNIRAAKNANLRMFFWANFVGVLPMLLVMMSWKVLTPF